MLALILLVASVAVADSVNPSTVVPAIWMAGTPKAHVGVFTAGVFATYLAGGLVLVLGPGPALISALHHMRGAVEHAVEAGVGVVVLAVAVGLWRSRHRETRARLPRPGCRPLTAFGLGAGIMAVELPTAFIYFGAISAVLAAHRTAALEVAALVVYNAVFVVPLLVILLIRRLAGDRAERWLASGWDRLVGFAQLLVAGLTGTAGAALLIVGVVGLAAR
ncbi:MAG TPA: GAP family protein [Solirubrobacteraceae bacterium]|nr:GAP family protein [Solirubrobacteraceae bacterium]